LLIAFLVASATGKLWLLLHDAFDIFDDNNSVIDDNTNRQHQCEQ